MPTSLYSPSADTYISSAATTTNYDGTDNLVVGTTEGFHSRTLLLFNLTNILQATILEATLSLYAHNIGSGTYEIWRITETGWIEDECTWNNYKTGTAWPGGAGAGSDADDTYEVEGTLPASVGWFQPDDLRLLIQEVVDNQNGYAHLLIKEKASGNTAQFYSTDYSEDSVHPTLEVKYFPYVAQTVLALDRKPLLRHIHHRDKESGF